MKNNQPTNQRGPNSKKFLLLYFVIGLLVVGAFFLLRSLREPELKILDWTEEVQKPQAVTVKFSEEVSLNESFSATLTNQTDQLNVKVNTKTSIDLLPPYASKILLPGDYTVIIKNIESHGNTYKFNINFRIIESDLSLLTKDEVDELIQHSDSFEGDQLLSTIPVITDDYIIDYEYMKPENKYLIEVTTRIAYSRDASFDGYKTTVKKVRESAKKFIESKETNINYEIIYAEEVADL